MNLTNKTRLTLDQQEEDESNLPRRKSTHQHLLRRKSTTPLVHDKRRQAAAPAPRVPKPELTAPQANHLQSLEVKTERPVRVTSSK